MQADGKSEVSKVVGRELQLPSLWCQPQIGYRHHTGVVDQKVERTVPAGDKRGERGWIGEIQLRDVDHRVAGRGDYVRGRIRPRFGVSNSEGDVYACPGERANGLDADAR